MQNRRTDPLSNRVITIYTKDLLLSERIREEYNQNNKSLSETINELVADGFKYRDLIEEGHIPLEFVDERHLITTRDIELLQRQIDELRMEINGNN